MKKIWFFISCISLIHALENKDSLAINNTESHSAILENNPPPQEAKKDSMFKEIWRGINAKGFAFARYFSINGDNGAGQSQQYRMKLDVTTGKVYGYSLTGGVLFSLGSGAIDKGRSTDGDVQGSRGTAFNDNFADRFNIATLYASKEINTDSFKAKIDLGKMNIVSLLSDKNLDLGLGGSAKFQHRINDKAELGYQVSFFDSWMSDHANYNIRRRSPKQSNDNQTPLSNQQAAAVGIGNNLTYVHFYGKNLSNGLHFNLVYANVWKLFDVMTFGDIGYKLKLGSHEIGFLGQLAFAGMNERPHIYVGWRGQPVITNFGDEFNRFSARYRGVYNLQMNYKWNGLSTKLGFLGSFSQGYAVLLSHKSGIDTAGKIWNGNLTATYDGLGIFGSGSFRGTNIGMAYLALNYKFHFPLKIGLDVSYFFGNNHFPVLDVTKPSKPTISLATPTGTISGGKTNFIDAKFFEIAPSISYAFIKNLEASFVCAVFTGDISFIKTRTELKWTF